MVPLKAALNVTVTAETIKRPKYREMVKAAINDLAERKGSSRQAIMKYIVGNYGVVDDNRSKALVRTALVESVKTGELVQTKGTGASGSFKIGKPTTKSKVKEKKNSTKETKTSQKKKNKDVQKEVKIKTEEKGKAQSDGKGSKKSKNESGAKATQKPPNPLVAKAAKIRRVKASGSAQSPNSKDRSASPLTAVKKIKAKLLFTSTPSKKKNKGVSKLLTPKRVVVKTKQLVKKPKTVG